MRNTLRHVLCIAYIDEFKVTKWSALSDYMVCNRFVGGTYPALYR
jgi:hypothetical protein